jgi:hypothetical protein
LISHLDSLKDCVDMQITIDKKDGFAHVNIWIFEMLKNTHFLAPRVTI